MVGLYTILFVSDPMDDTGLVGGKKAQGDESDEGDDVAVPKRKRRRLADDAELLSIRTEIARLREERVELKAKLAEALREQAAQQPPHASHDDNRPPTPKN